MINKRTDYKTYNTIYPQNCWCSKIRNCPQKANTTPRVDKPNKDYQPSN